MEKPGPVQKFTTVNIWIPRDSICDTIRQAVQRLCQFCPDRRRCAVWACFNQEEE